MTKFNILQQDLHCGSISSSPPCKYDLQLKTKIWCTAKHRNLAALRRNPNPVVGWSADRPYVAADHNKTYAGVGRKINLKKGLLSEINFAQSLIYNPHVWMSFCEVSNHSLWPRCRSWGCSSHIRVQNLQKLNRSEGSDLTQTGDFRVIGKFVFGLLW